MTGGPGPSWPADIFGRPLVQPDQRSCGAASLVVARAVERGCTPVTPEQAYAEVERIRSHEMR